MLLSDFKKLISQHLGGKFSKDEACQFRLDHKTALYLAKHGQRDWQIAKNIKRPLAITKVFIETPIEIWNDLMAQHFYQDWAEKFCNDGSSLRKIPKRNKMPLKRI